MDKQHSQRTAQQEAADDSDFDPVGDARHASQALRTKVAAITVTLVAVVGGLLWFWHWLVASLGEAFTF